MGIYAALIGIDLYREELIFVEENWSLLIGNDRQWSLLNHILDQSLKSDLYIDLNWLAHGIDPSCPELFEPFQFSAAFKIDFRFSAGSKCNFSSFLWLKNGIFQCQAKSFFPGVCGFSVDFPVFHDVVRAIPTFCHKHPQPANPGLMYTSST